MENAKHEEKEFNYFFGLINLVVVFGIVWLLWYIFMNPNTVMKLYTPMYGFALLVVMLSAIVLMSNVARLLSFFTALGGRRPRRKGDPAHRRRYPVNALHPLRGLLEFPGQVRHRLL